MASLRRSPRGSLSRREAVLKPTLKPTSRPSTHTFPCLRKALCAHSTAFYVKEIGDVHVTWENEALREVAESKGKMQIVYPPVSVLAEPYVAWVDKFVAERGTSDIAKAYLNFLFTDEAQVAIARLGYRPYKPGITEKAGVQFADVKLLPPSAISPDWNDLNDKFFSENGIVTAIVEGLKR